MSDTARPKSAGDKLSAAEINQDLPVQMTSGEAINGATLPVAVYIKDDDGEVYACDADDQDALEFIGFGISNSTDGNDITIQTKGIVSGFSGLDAGKKYYVQDDKTIGTTPGTYNVLVGMAISATQILIIKEKATHAAESILADYQANAATGTMTNPEYINDNNTSTIAYADTVDEYAEINFGKVVRIKKWSQCGHVSNDGDGVFKIQYYDDTNESWIDWVTGLNTKNTNGCGDYEALTEVITTKVRIVNTTIDSSGQSRFREIRIVHTE